ncbi:hypothetical protein MBLNU230_g7107t1 [Neophaeotheca triangularis]
MLFNRVSLVAGFASLSFAAVLPTRDAQCSQVGEFTNSSLSLREVGARNTLDWRMWLERNGEPISFWHDVPLYPHSNDTSIVNVVVEVPRWENGKIEIQREEPLNPIFHDERNDAPRFVQNVWPQKTYPFLYGSIPQTWESPNFDHEFVNEPGDNDPMDFFDIGQDPGYIGQVKQVKVLGSLAVNDGGETDWKVLCIDVNDPIAPLVNDFIDVEIYRPGLLTAYRNWWTIYKVARGDDLIPITGQTYQDAAYTRKTVGDSHEFWRELIRGEVDTGDINYNQTSECAVDGSYIASSKATQELDIPAEPNVLPPAPRPQFADEWFYLNSNNELIPNDGTDLSSTAGIPKDDEDEHD